jgi:hypothetical protein
MKRPQDILRVREMAKRFGLEFLPPSAYLLLRV